MNSIPMRRESAIETPKSSTIDMRLEVVVIPVSDVDSAKHFYGGLGWRLDIDYSNGENFRVIQFTPPGSECSIIFGKDVTTAAPGSARGLHLVVSDIEAARDDLLRRGVVVSELFHDAGGIFHHADREGQLSGPNPQRLSYASYAEFSDPDGNGWLLQEITVRAPGRITSELADALQHTAAIHG